MNSSPPSLSRADVDVHGSGLVARSMALALAQAGFRVGVSPDELPIKQLHAAHADIRAFAITPASRRLLECLGVWPAEDAGSASPVLAMAVHDGASCLRFSAQEQGVDELAHLLEPATLEAALSVALMSHERVIWRPPQLAWAEAVSKLQIICEGGASRLRQTVGVEFDVWDYEQRAISMQLRLSRPHQHGARQWFDGGEVLALLPLGASAEHNRVAVVWSVAAQRSAQLMALDPSEMLVQLKVAMGDSGAEVGEITLCSERQTWPLAAARAKQFSGVHEGRAWVLAGDAAHRVHPLAGLGLNLGLGDVDALVRVLSHTQGAQHWREVSDAKLLREYARERQTQAQATIAVTDGLFQLVRVRQPDSATQFIWPSLRRIGLGAVQNAPVLKRWIASQAMR